jgi:8-oxo-dGTP diphosphatase
MENKLMCFTVKENPLYLITGQPENDVEKFLALLTSSLIKGVKLVQIRAKSLSSDQYAILAKEAVKLCHQYQAKALLNQHPHLLNLTQADGIHLPSQQLMQLTQRPVSAKLLFSAACHTKEQILHASAIKADFVVLSPVLATPSSPNGIPLGWKNFENIARIVDVPLYALGGMTPKDIPIAKAHGAIGIAAIRSLWG